MPRKTGGAHGGRKVHVELTATNKISPAMKEVAKDTEKAGKAATKASKEVEKASAKAEKSSARMAELAQIGRNAAARYANQMVVDKRRSDLAIEQENLKHNHKMMRDNINFYRKKDLLNEQYNRKEQLENLRYSHRQDELGLTSFDKDAGVGANVKVFANNYGHILQSLASVVYLVEKLFNAIKNGLGSVMSTFDTIRQQKARLNLYNNSNKTSDELFSLLGATALDSRSDLEATGELSNRLVAAGIYKGPNAIENTLSTVGLINKSLIAGGGAPQEIRSVLLQLSQGLSQGNLQGQELRAIRQYAPYMGNILAEGLNKQGIFDKEIVFGDLKELGAKGELTTERILKAFELMQDKIKSDFDSMPKTWGQAMTSMEILWTMFLAKLDVGEGGIQAIIDKMWEFVDFLASEDSADFWEGMTTLANTFFTVLSMGLDLAIQGFVWLGENIDGVIALISTLGSIYLLTTAIMHWKILLIIGAIFAVSEALNHLGVSGTQVLSVIVGVLAVIIEAVQRLVTGIGYHLVGAFQTLGAIANTIIGSILTGLGQILSALGIDWGDKLVTWGTDALAKGEELAQAAQENKTKGNDALFGGKGVDEVYNEASNKVLEAGAKISDLANSYEPPKNYPYDPGEHGIPVDAHVSGGKLDKVDEMGDDEIELLRDIASRDYLLNVSTITPTVNNTFGDIKETADVNAIIETIDRMIDEELATSVVMG